MDTRTFLNFSVPISHSTNPWFVGGAYYYYDYVMRIVAKCLQKTFKTFSSSYATYSTTAAIMTA